MGGSASAVITFVQTLRQHHLYPAMLYFMDNQESLLTSVKQISPETVTIYRTKLLNDSPQYPGDAVFEAQKDFALVRTRWAGVKADLFEPINEWVGIPMQYKVAYLLEFLRLADANGFKLAIPADPPGNPTEQEYVAYLPLYQYIVAHPGHAISRHNYGIATLLSQSGIYLGYRHRLDYTIMLALYPQAAEVPVYLTETAAYDGRVEVGCGVLVADYMTYLDELDHDPYVKGLAAFTVSGNFEWASITNCLPALTEAIINR